MTCSSVHVSLLLHSAAVIPSMRHSSCSRLRTAVRLRRDRECHVLGKSSGSFSGFEIRVGFRTYFSIDVFIRSCKSPVSFGRRYPKHAALLLFPVSDGGSPPQRPGVSRFREVVLTCFWIRDPSRVSDVLLHRRVHPFMQVSCFVRPPVSQACGTPPVPGFGRRVVPAETGGVTLSGSRPDRFRDSRSESDFGRTSPLTCSSVHPSGLFRSAAGIPSMRHSSCSRFRTAGRPRRDRGCHAFGKSS